MTCYLELNEKSIGLAAAGAAMLGLSLSDGLLQPAGSLRARREARAAATATRVADHAAATLAAVSAEQPLPAAAPAEPAAAPAAEPQPMAPEAEDALLALLDA